MSDKGWQFTYIFWEDGEQHRPVTVVILGEIGDPALNTWIKDEDMYYEDEDHAKSIGMDAVMDKYEVERNVVQWIQTDVFHPDHLLGLEEVDIGVWI